MDNEKKYKELEGKIKKAYLYAQTDSTKAVLEDILPELKESEDERIRKELIAYHRSMAVAMNGNRPCVHEAWIDWLEEQGDKPQGKTALEAWKEKKVDNSNKVKPKFHEGEWIVWQDKCCKVNYNGCGYELIDQNGLSTSLEYGTADENAHLWDTTKDAKDGDVLVSDNIVFIFNKIHDAWINCHCSTHKDGSFMEEDYDLMTIKYSKEVYPATKEQCDKLLKAMADAGYTFDFDKKELKKIEKPTAWSEEDERMMLSIEQIMNCASLLNIVPQKIDKVRAWLKSLKERIGE